MIGTGLALLVQTVAAVVPLPSAVVCSHGTGGACSGGSVSVSATVHIAWTITAPNPSTYKTRIKRSGADRSGLLLNTATSFDDTVQGYIENGLINKVFTSNYTYTVEIVRISDGVVVASAAAQPWVQDYGNCSGGGGHQ